MEFVGKMVKLHLSTPLMAINGHPVHAMKGKILENFPNGVLIQIESVEPKKDLKYAYTIIFVPTHKIDFIGVSA